MANNHWKCVCSSTRQKGRIFMKSKFRKLTSLALTLVMALTLTVPAFAYIPEGKPVPEPSPGELPGKFNSTWSIDDPYWYTRGYKLGDYGSIYTNPNGPAQVYVPDEVQYLLEIENNNMTSISLPKHVIGSYLEADIDQCTEVIIRGLTKEDLTRNACLFVHAPAKAAPIKNESGEILGWIGGDRSNRKPYNASDKYPTVIGGWRMVNMVNPPDLDTAETVVIPDGTKSVDDRTFYYDDLGIDNFDNPNMKVLSLPKSCYGFGFKNGDFSKLTEIIYCGTEEDLIANRLYCDVPATPVKDESGNLLGWVGGEYGKFIGGPKKLNLASNKPEQPSEPLVTGFADVQSADWYAKAVKWAVDNGITSGTSKTTFSPTDTCTHVQVIAFLHRAAGSPTVNTTLPFTPKNTWATEALKWAYANYMIVGGRVEFDENASCTRAEAVNYIWEALDRPVANLLYTDDFTDVPDRYELAIAWAVQHKVTSGTSETTFSPDLICNRGTIVTLLYNAYSGK